MPCVCVYVCIRAPHVRCANVRVHGADVRVHGAAVHRYREVLMCSLISLCLTMCIPTEMVS